MCEHTNEQRKSNKCVSFKAAITQIFSPGVRIPEECALAVLERITDNEESDLQTFLNNTTNTTIFKLIQRGKHT